jgi:hypothetical protein
VSTSDRLLAVAFASALFNFTHLKYTVQSSHSLVRCPQSSTFCIHPSSGDDASSSLSTSSPFSCSYSSTLVVRRSNLLCPQSFTFCVDLLSAGDASSCSTASALSPSSPSCLSISLIPRSNLLSSVTACCHWVGVRMASSSSLPSPSFSKFSLPSGIPECSLSSVQFLSIGMSGSALPISGS